MAASSELRSCTTKLWLHNVVYLIEWTIWSNINIKLCHTLYFDFIFVTKMVTSELPLRVGIANDKFLFKEYFS